MLLLLLLLRTAEKNDPSCPSLQAIYHNVKGRRRGGGGGIVLVPASSSSSSGGIKDGPVLCVWCLWTGIGPAVAELLTSFPKSRRRTQKSLSTLRRRRRKTKTTPWRTRARASHPSGATLRPRGKEETKEEERERKKSLPSTTSTTIRPRWPTHRRDAIYSFLFCFFVF